MAETLFNTLSPDEREFAESILRASPEYRYDLRGLHRSIHHQRPVVPLPQPLRRRWPRG